MNKFCTGCGKPLKGGAKFCVMCGKQVVSQKPGHEDEPRERPIPIEKVSAKTDDVPSKANIASAKINDSPPEVGARHSTKGIHTPDRTEERDTRGRTSSMGEAFSSKTKNVFGKAKARVKAKTKAEAKSIAGIVAKTAAKDILSGNSLALATIGESVLPVALDASDAGNILSLLKDGLTELLKGAKQILKDKKRLTLVGVLAGVWLLVNVLSALGISPLPVRFLSWLTFARGGLIGGSVGKGILTAFFTRFITGGNMLSPLKGIFGRLQGIAGKDKEDLPVFLIGTGAALIAANMLISSTLQNTMMPIAAFMLGAAAVRRNSFLHRFTTALLPRVKVGAITIAMEGWALGFLVFTVLCILPGGNNGYLAGVLSLGAAVGLQFLKKDKKEVPAR